MIDPFDEEEDEANSWDSDEPNCTRCGGSGKVTTDDFESYYGACYKPCPECHGDPCTGEPPLS